VICTVSYAEQRQQTALENMFTKGKGNKMRKRIFWILILSFIMMSVLIPTTVFAADSNLGGVVTLDGITGDITAGSLKTRVEALVGINNATDVKELHIGTDVSGSLNAADTDYINKMVDLEVLNVETTVTVAHTISWFCVGFDKLTRVTFPATTFGNRAFSFCPVLNYVSLPKATDFGYLPFDDCFLLTTVKLPKATIFGFGAFADCTSLSIVELPKATTFGTVTFEGCAALNSLTLGSTVPTVASWGLGFTPGTLNIPASAVSAYDANQQTWVPAGTTKDGLWEGWTLNGIGSIVANPQTGYRLNYTWMYILFGIAIVSGLGLIIKKKLRS